MGTEWDDDETPGAGHNSAYDATSQELRSFFERMDQLDKQIEDAKDDKKELYAEMKGRGFDRKAFDKARKAIAINANKSKRDGAAETREITMLYLRGLDEDDDLVDLLL